MGRLTLAPADLPQRWAKKEVEIAALRAENERLRAVLQQIAGDPDMDITATHIAKNALAQSR